MPNGTYGGVRGRKTKVGRKLLRFPPTRLSKGKRTERLIPTPPFRYPLGASVKLGLILVRAQNDIDFIHFGVEVVFSNDFISQFLLDLSTLFKCFI